VADIQKMEQFVDASFDTVFSCETIEHVPDPPLAVRQLARVLKPGGRLFLTTPNYLSTIGLYRVYCWVRGKKFDEGGQPICQVNMTVKTRRWVNRAGLRVVRTAGHGQYLPFPGRPPIRVPFLERPHFLTKWVLLHSLVVGEKPAAKGG
ncbi:MAG TPA: methyltransferase domain-containing protein, partial [Gemmataceae bacterium]|nr:methyltransferase domain-containing protein [Gemmataceae bacterium]